MYLVIADFLTDLYRRQGLEPICLWFTPLRGLKWSFLLLKTEGILLVYSVMICVKACSSV